MNKVLQFFDIFSDQQMVSCVNLDSWVIIVPQKEGHIVDELVQKLQRVCQPMRFMVARPMEV